MKLRSIALAGVALAALTIPASAMDKGWYVGLGVGYDSMANIKATYTALPAAPAGTPTPFTTTSPTQSSALFAAMFGYRFENGIRVEDEISYDSHNVSAGTGTTPGVAGTTAIPFTGSASIRADIFTVYYDYEFLPRWSATAGVGLGWSVFSANISAVPPGSAAVSTYLHGTDDGLIWQGVLGVTYALSDNTNVGLDYRYRSFTSQHTAYGIAFTNYKGTAADVPDQAFMLTVRYHLGGTGQEEEAAPPPPPAPATETAPTPPPAPVAPPAPPPPPAPVKTFIVFFDFNKANLTQAARAVVSEAVKAAKANGSVKVMITGHTDTVGSDKYNMKLSVRRAQSVKQEMVHEGIKRRDISVQGKGFHDPLVPTGPGVREPQNRRAVIDLGG